MLALKDRRQHRKINLRLSAGLLAFTIATDQLTKALAENYLADTGEISMVGGLITFSLVRNYEGFLGIARGLPPSVQFFFLYVCVGVLLVACLFYLFFLRRPNPRYALPLCLVTGGGLSNLIDRILHGGGVTDFMVVTVGWLHTGIFNLADVFILVGSFVIGALFFAKLDT